MPVPVIFFPLAVVRVVFLGDDEEVDGDEEDDEDEALEKDALPNNGCLANERGTLYMNEEPASEEKLDDDELDDEEEGTHNSSNSKGLLIGLGMRGDIANIVSSSSSPPSLSSSASILRKEEDSSISERGKGERF